MGLPLEERQGQLSRAVKESNRLAVTRIIEEHGKALYALTEDLTYKGHVTLGVAGENFRRIAALPTLRNPLYPVPTGNENTVWVKGKDIKWWNAPACIHGAAGR